MGAERAEWEAYRAEVRADRGKRLAVALTLPWDSNSGVWRIARMLEARNGNTYRGESRSKGYARELGETYAPLLSTWTAC